MVSITSSTIASLTWAGNECWAIAQYFRRECVETLGTATSVLDNKVEETFCKLWTMLGSKLRIVILNPSTVLAVKVVQQLNSVIGKTAKN